MRVTNKILPFLLVAMLSAVPSFAQTGNLEGKVTDVDGKPLIGATMQIDRQGIAGQYTVKTDKNGAYLHAGLPTGNYRVSVVKDGKTIPCVPNVAVKFGGSTPANCDLRQAVAAGNSEEDKAKAAAEKAKADATKAAFDQGIAAMTAKNYADAAKFFQQASEQDATQHVIFGNLGQALSEGRKYDDAANAYRKAIELKPDEAPYYNNLGIALGNAGKIDEAIQSLQKAAELNPPGAGQSYYNLGAVLTNRNRTKEAGEAFKKAIEFNPNMPQAYYQLGISYFGSPTTIGEAVPVLEKFLSLVAALPDPQKAGFAQDVEAAKQLIDAAKQSAPTGFKSEKAIADEKAAAEAKQKADAAKAKKKN